MQNEFVTSKDVTFSHGESASSRLGDRMNQISWQKKRHPSATVQLHTSFGTPAICFTSSIAGAAEDACPLRLLTMVCKTAALPCVPDKTYPSPRMPPISMGHPSRGDAAMRRQVVGLWVFDLGEVGGRLRCRKTLVLVWEA